MPHCPYLFIIYIYNYIYICTPPLPFLPCINLLLVVTLVTTVCIGKIVAMSLRESQPKMFWTAARGVLNSLKFVKLNSLILTSTHLAHYMLHPISLGIALLATSADVATAAITCVCQRNRYKHQSFNVLQFELTGQYVKTQIRNLFLVGAGINDIEFSHVRAQTVTISVPNKFTLQILLSCGWKQLILF